MSQVMSCSSTIHIVELVALRRGTLT